LYFNLEETDELLEGNVSISDTNNNTAIE